MKIHEYQGKELLKRYGVRVPRGIPCFSVDEAVKAAEALGGPVWVVKAQIHAGGRGKGGGVKVAKSIDEVRTYVPGYRLKQDVQFDAFQSGLKTSIYLEVEGAGHYLPAYAGNQIGRAHV